MVRKLFVSTGIVLSCLGSYAQSADSLTLQNVKETALKYNREIQKAGLTLKEAQSSTWEAISSGLPQVDATVDYSNYFNKSLDFGGAKIAMPATSNLNVKATQLIFSGNYIVGVQTAKLFKELSEKRVTQSELDVIEQVLKSSYIVLATERNVQILEKNLENVKDLYKRTESLAKVGVIEETQVLQLSVQVMNLENSLSSAKNQLDLVRNMLRIQLGLKQEQPVVLKGTIDEYAAALNLSSFTNQGFNIENNISYQLIDGQEGIKQKQVALAKMAYLPTIAGYYSYTTKLLDGFSMTPTHVIGLQASIPIFSSGQRKSKVDQAKFQQRSVQLDKEQLLDNLNVQAVNIKNNLNTYHEQYLVQLKNVEVSKTVYEKYVSKFEQGMASSIDLTTTNNSYLSAEMSLVNSMLQLLEAKIDFEKLYGTLN